MDDDRSARGSPGSRAGPVNEQERLWPELDPEPEMIYPEPPVVWPSTVDAAVEHLAKTLSAADLDSLRAMARRDLPDLFRTGLGLWIRNFFGLWRGNEALLASCAAFSSEHELLFPTWGDPEDASLTILEALWMHLEQLT